MRALAVLLPVLMAATVAAGPWKNLRVLPDDLDAEDLEAVMVRMGRALGVSCSHCHAADRATDERPAKAVARRMIQMTVALNRDYFDAPDAPVVSCATCHRGQRVPPTHVPSDRRRPERPEAPARRGPAGPPTPRRSR